MAAGMVCFGKTVPEQKHIELFVNGALFAWDTLQAEKSRKPKAMPKAETQALKTVETLAN
jgi:hypothetical protein